MNQRVHCHRCAGTYSFHHDDGCRRRRPVRIASIVIWLAVGIILVKVVSQGVFL